MIRFVIRVVATFSLAGGFALALVDGTRSVSDGQPLLTSLADLFAMAGLAAAPGVTGGWMATMRVLLAPAPACIALVVLALVLYFIASPGRARPYTTSL